MLLAADQAVIRSYAPALLAASRNEVIAAVRDGGPLRDRLALHGDRRFQPFLAPFDWINENADIVLVGVTPGRQQAAEALIELRAQLLLGKTVDEAAAAAKASASFKGGMRTNSVRLMDHFGLNELFGVSTTAELYGRASGRVHYTSAIRYPVLAMKQGKWSDYSGHARILKEPVLRDIIDRLLPGEFEMLPDAWIVPFGGTAGLVVDEMVRRGILSETKVLSGVLHPAGGQQNRFNCQLGLVDHADCAPNVGCSELRRRTGLLFEKLAGLRAAAMPSR